MTLDFTFLNTDKLITELIYFWVTEEISKCLQFVHQFRGKVPFLTQIKEPVLGFVVVDQKLWVIFSSLSLQKCSLSHIMCMHTIKKELDKRAYQHWQQPSLCYKRGTHCSATFFIQRNLDVVPDSNPPLDTEKVVIL